MITCPMYWFCSISNRLISSWSVCSSLKMIQKCICYNKYITRLQKAYNTMSCVLYLLISITSPSHARDAILPIWGVPDSACWQNRTSGVSPDWDSSIRCGKDATREGESADIKIQLYSKGCNNSKISRGGEVRWGESCYQWERTPRVRSRTHLSDD